MATAKWPKILPPLSAEQQRISDDFMRAWHEELGARRRYGLIERFNHGFPVARSHPGFKTTLEIGAGLGEHLRYEKLTPAQESNYYANDLRPNMAAEFSRRFPTVKTIVADCQERMPFADGFFDRVIAVHVLEHLANLPAAVGEIHRLLNRTHGQLLAVIPTEGSPAYALARKLSAERVYRKRYGGDYAWFYRREHLNLPHEILTELERHFVIERRRFFPLPFAPMISCNLCIGLDLKPRPQPVSG